VRLTRFLLLLVLALLIGGAVQAFPITLSLVPSSLSLDPGETLTVEVYVEGLEDEEESQVALESFDLEISFDKTRLSFDSLSFGITLGDPDDNGETFLTGPGTPNTTGIVEMGEFSFLSEVALLALQNSPPLLLATIEFTALNNPGAAVLAFSSLGSGSLGGMAGDPLGDELDTPSALNVAIVPEPGAAALLLTGGALLARRRGARV
jgi:hypothetical protein